MGWVNESLFKWPWSHDQDDHDAHMWLNTLKNLLQNQVVKIIETWYIALVTRLLPSLFK